jgi:hypothetical protein
MVLNKGKDEGVLFRDRTDALIAAGTIKPSGFYSSLADYFSESYEDNKKSVVQVNIDIGEDVT